MICPNLKIPGSICVISGYFAVSFPQTPKEKIKEKKKKPKKLITNITGQLFKKTSISFESTCLSGEQDGLSKKQSLLSLLDLQCSVSISLVSIFPYPIIMMDEEPEDQEEVEYDENTEFDLEEDSVLVTEAPPTESAFGKYLREYRLLNSLLLSLGIIVGIIGFMLAWTIVIQVGEEGDSDFGEAGPPAAQQQQQVQKQMQKLMQRQKKATPLPNRNLKPPISEIALPDFNELDVKDLAPVVEAALPDVSDQHE